MTLYHAAEAWIDGGYVSDMLIETDGSAITAIRPFGGEVATPVRLAGPALTDLQVNGSGGVMLNSAPTAETIAHIVGTQRARGTGWVMPTLITSEAALLAQATEAALEAWGTPGFLGLHIEGPHLNVARKGTHNPAFIRPFEPETMDAARRLREAGIPVMLTLAPECVPAESITELAGIGVIVSAGHSAATADEAQAGLKAGVSCFTHLYNAMPPMTSRDPGILGAAINSDAYAGIIVDGHHVSWPMVALACRARPEKARMFMVSDAMSTIGGPDHFELYGERIEVRDGALVNAAGSLAGAHVDLVTCLRNGVGHVGLPLHEAYEMAAIVPYDAMNLPRPTLKVGTPVEELLCLDAALARV
ncbi:N-acetylglucosamine-6-phosphate deacetylase [Salipiger pallidus]|uniref:N-acetylglucosamine-6-phosphate deacetylase n=1 Tax=Salipiger pallidus TaxID=1775170 RepID=A0A8J2ZN77_9RHOB|nr:N-acetylglucosamine-6-phosphate deacetylase [Salipiger pallidus]GGG83435.1 N-acetylglucosamine-6-phosphate deacetylase [Salipiger pallidus]